MSKDVAALAAQCADEEWDVPLFAWLQQANQQFLDAPDV